MENAIIRKSYTDLVFTAEKKLLLYKTESYLCIDLGIAVNSAKENKSFSHLYHHLPTPFALSFYTLHHFFCPSDLFVLSMSLFGHEFCKSRLSLNFVGNEDV